MFSDDHAFQAIGAYGGRFKDLNLTPNAISLVITTDDNGGPHIDALKGIRFLWPVKNCKNSYTRFLDIDPNNVGIEQLPNGIIYYVRKRTFR